MEEITKRSDLVFGKFLKHKISDLAAIKGGVQSTQTQTTRCTSYESTFDSDQEVFIETLKGCES
jgi:hypothetical protein